MRRVCRSRVFIVIQFYRRGVSKNGPEVPNLVDGAQGANRSMQPGPYPRFETARRRMPRSLHHASEERQREVEPGAHGLLLFDIPVLGIGICHRTAMSAAIRADRTPDSSA